MKGASVSEARNSLSALLDRVRHGETVLITDRGRAVARLEPVARGEAAGEDAGRLDRLERAGIVRRAARGRLAEIARSPPPGAAPGADVVEALLEERRSGR